MSTNSKLRYKINNIYKDNEINMYNIFSLIKMLK